MTNYKLQITNKFQSPNFKIRNLVLVFNIRNYLGFVNWKLGFTCYIILLIFTTTHCLATRYANDFENMGASARAFGLGGSYVASVSDPSSVYYNPAASASLLNQQVIFLHSENFEKGIVKNNFLAYVKPYNEQAYGVAILTNRIPDIKITKLPYPDLPPGDTNQPYLDKIVNASDWIIYFNYARNLNNYFSLGGNFKIIYRSLGIGSSFGIGIDGGAIFKIQPDFKIALKVTNLTTSPLFWSNKTREALSPNIILGITKSFNINSSSILISSDLETAFDKFKMNTNLGVEYLYKNTLGLRFGLYHWNPTFGIGLSLKRFFIDYAYLSRYNEEDLGASQKFSGGIRF